jgi:hypothetical protein
MPPAPPRSCSQHAQVLRISCCCDSKGLSLLTTAHDPGHHQARLTMVSTRSSTPKKVAPTEGAETATEAPTRRASTTPTLFTFARQNPELVLGMLAMLAYMAFNFYQMGTGTGRWKILNDL